MRYLSEISLYRQVKLFRGIVFITTHAAFFMMSMVLELNPQSHVAQVTFFCFLACKNGCTNLCVMASIKTITLCADKVLKDVVGSGNET